MSGLIFFRSALFDRFYHTHVIEGAGEAVPQSAVEVVRFEEMDRVVGSLLLEAHLQNLGLAHL